MRIDAEAFVYSLPAWQPPYDAARLAALGAPQAAAAALTGRSLPLDALSHFVRVPERELAEDELPECGRAAFLGQAGDGFNNTYWLSLADGSVWMRYGGRDEPVNHMKRINTTVTALQDMLAVYVAYLVADSEDPDVEEREQLIDQTVIRAVAADPEPFRDDANWWSQTFQEVEFTSIKILLGDRSLYELVHRDEDGHWYLDHPGYEDEDE